MSEKRSSEQREKCRIDAAIAFADDRLDCVVEDISARGAKLRLAVPRELPPLFKLQLPLVEGIVDQRVVALRWMLGTAVGVRFEQNEPSNVIRPRSR